eukprot:309154_1
MSMNISDFDGYSQIRYYGTLKNHKENINDNKKQQDICDIGHMKKDKDNKDFLWYNIYILGFILKWIKHEYNNYNSDMVYVYEISHVKVEMEKIVLIRKMLICSCR